MASFIHRRTAEYRTVDEAGNEYLVVEYTNFTTYEAADGGVLETRAGAKEYALHDGTVVKRLGDALEFEVVHSGIRLRRKV